MRDRTLVIRVVLGVIIVVCMLWCGRIGVRAYRLVTTLRALGNNAVRLEQVDTALGPGSRVVWDSATVATVRSRARLRAANGTEKYDSAANARWDALLSPILRDSARFGPQKGRPIQDVPGLGDAVRVLTGPGAAVLYTAEFVSGADTAGLERAASRLYATVDSGDPLVVHLRAGRPRGAERGGGGVGLTTIIVPVF
jgi:hypothetical protein